MKTFRIFGVSLLLMLVAASVAAAENLRIAIIVPMTGALAEYGYAVKNAIVLAQEEHPDIAQRLSFTFDDNGSDNTQAVSAFNKVLSTKSADLVLMWGFGPVQAVAPLAESSKMPLISISAERTISIGKRYQIRFNFFAEQVGEALAEYLRARGLKKFGLVRTEHVFLNAIAEGFRGGLHTEESLQEIETFLPQDRDFLPAVLKARRMNLDALGVLMLPGQISRFFRQAGSVQAKFTSFGPHTFESYVEIADAQGGMEGAVFGIMDFKGAFQRRYLKRFGHDNHVSFAANAYDFVMLSSKLFAQHDGALSPEEVLNRYRAAPPQDGETGRYYYVDNEREGPSFHFDVVVKRISGGKIVDAGNGESH